MGCTFLERIAFASGNGMPSSLPEIREYIDRHYAKQLSVPHLAKLAGLSRFHFIRACRVEAGGEAPAAYRAARRTSPRIPDCFIRMYRVDR